MELSSGGLRIANGSSLAIANPTSEQPNVGALVATTVQFSR